MLVEIWSDIACPWCYVGKRRFERAVEMFDGRDELRVVWRSFELDPAAPPCREGDSASHVARKYGRTREQALAGQAQLREIAAADGLDLRPDLQRIGNTFDAHRVAHLAARHGVQGETVERLMRGYHCEGVLVSDARELERLSVEAGLPAGAVAAMLDTDELAAAVRADERLAAQMGCSAVPFFVVDRRFAATGAQSAEVLVDMLDHAAAQPRASADDVVS